MSDLSTWASADATIDQPLVSTRVLDLAFLIQSKSIPVDHAKPLSSAVLGKLPWLEDEPLAGLHLIHVAGSQNGWIRPDEPEALLYPSRRTRLIIRVPFPRLEDALALEGETLDIQGQPMKVGKASQREITSTDVLLARHVILQDGEQESAFLNRVSAEISQLGLSCRKMLPGRMIKLATSNGAIETQSLLVADLKPADSILLQEEGVGEGRHFGCGLFIPHKGLGTAVQ